MDHKMADSIYDVLKIKLKSEDKTYTHSEIVAEASTICQMFAQNDSELIDYIVARYEENHTNIKVHTPDVLTENPFAGKWLERKKALSSDNLTDGYFKRYKSYLRRDDFDESVIDQMEIDCEMILKQCANPELTIEINERKKKGLVVGDVQSGKTANYLGLINMACDYGYKIVVLLAGMTDSLRQQTQSRVDEGFIGAVSDSIGTSDIAYVGVGFDTDVNQHHAIPLTNNENDFVKFVKKNYNFTSGDFNKPVVLVVKKNGSVLKQLCDWLSPGTNNIKYENILIIDDEADNASINTKKPECDPSKINGYIRNLFNNFPIASYVGYTATPFANIFINPENDESNMDLFPSDFIVLLNAPSNYFGALKVFSYDSENISRVLREIDEGERNFLPAKHKKDEYYFMAMPESMKESILCFLLNNAIRTIRGAGKKHRSMLINISVFNNMHEQIRDVVANYVENIKYIIEQDSYKPTSEFIRNLEMNKLYGIYHGDVQYCINGVDFYSDIRKSISWEEIKTKLLEEIEKFEVVIINNKNKKNRFSYKDEKYKEKGARVIAIGGYVLSRGLTLEGLMISYFSRNSSAYDSLLQMCRWFGYRPGYEDLCRVYISDINIMNFRAVIEAVDDLKMQFREMIVRKRKPIDFGLMVREAPDSLETSLIITSRNKMYNSGKIEHVVSYGGTYADTSKLYCPGNANRKNVMAVDWLFSTLTENCNIEWTQYQTPNSYRRMLRNVENKYIAKFLKKLQIPYENTKFDVQNLSEYIANSNCFKTWDIVIASGSGESEFLWSVQPAKRTFRKRKDEAFVRIGDKNNRIIEPSIFSSGLSDDQLRMAKAHAIERVNKAGKGNPDILTVVDYLAITDRNPLLVIYPMTLWAPKENCTEELKVIESINNETMVGFAVGFPAKVNAEKMKYRANKVKIKEIEQSRSEPEVDEEFYEDE